MNHEPPLKRGTNVEFDIGQGLTVGKGIIADAEYDDGWLYQIDVVEGDPAEAHRNKRGELWACEFEFHPSVEG